MALAELPTGTVTFLFTDLEGSTRLWEEHPEAMRGALARHDEILRDAVEKRDGVVVKTTGDGLHAVFASARGAVAAAVDAQLALVAEDWTLPEPLRVRMGLHTGEADLRSGDYYGPAVNRAARVSAAGHGGQILVSHATEELVRDDLPEGAGLVDLGEQRLRDLAASGTGVPGDPFRVGVGVRAGAVPGRFSDEPARAAHELRGTRARGRGCRRCAQDGAAGDPHRGRGSGQDPPRARGRRGGAAASSRRRVAVRAGTGVGVRRGARRGRERGAASRPARPRWARPNPSATCWCVTSPVGTCCSCSTTASRCSVRSPSWSMICWTAVPG